MNKKNLEIFLLILAFCFEFKHLACQNNDENMYSDKRLATAAPIMNHDEKIDESSLVEKFKTSLHGFGACKLLILRLNYYF